MATRDTLHNLVVRPARNPATLDATGNGITIDTQGLESLTFAVQIGAISAADASNRINVTMEHSNTVDGSGDITSGAAVPAGMILGTLPVINNANQANKAFTVGYVGDRRYVRLAFTETGTFSAVVGAVAVLGHGRHNPVAS